MKLMKRFGLFTYFIGVEVKFKNSLYPVLILPNQIKEMTEISVQDNSLKIGASVTLSDLEATLIDHIKGQPSKY